MTCIFRARVNSLWSMWYTVLLTLLQVYLLYLGFERYKLYTDMKWPHGGFPRLQLSIYIALHAFSIPLCLLFVAFGVFKSGNMAGDSERIGARLDRILEISHGKNGGGNWLLRKLKAAWQHSPPIPQTLHLLIAFVQLIAQQIMIAQLYRNGFLNSGDYLSTEMDFIYQRARQLANNLPMGESPLQSFRITADELSNQPIGPKLLPVLMQARLFGIPLEFVNFLLALFAYAIAYPSVFWRANKAFAFVFSSHLLIHIAVAIWGYLGFTILYRIQEANYGRPRTLGLGQHLATSQPILLYQPNAILANFAITTLLISLAPIALYAYGYNKYQINWLALRNRAPTIIANGGGGAIEAEGLVGTPRSHQKQQHNRHKTQLRAGATQLCCDGYGPHIFAIILLVLIVILKSPTIYALMVLYQHEPAPLLLSCIVIDIGYLFTWILLWLVLTLKRDWKFIVAYSTHEIIAIQHADRRFSGCVNGTTTTGRSASHRSISELKNALLLMHGDEMYITDDPVTKQSVLKHAQKFGLGQTQEDVYWLKANVTAAASGGYGSPSTRKIPLDESAKSTPEMSRLLGGGPSSNSAMVRRNSSQEALMSASSSGPTTGRSFQTIGHRPPQQQQRSVNTATYQRYSDSSPPDDQTRSSAVADPTMITTTFGTLQRADMQQRRIAQPPLSQVTQSQRNILASSNSGEYHHYGARPPLPNQETYASIHKTSRSGLGGTSAVITDGSVPASMLPSMIHRDSYGRLMQQQPDDDQLSRGSSYANIPSGYASTSYGVYSRVPPQARVIAQQQQMQLQHSNTNSTSATSALRNNGNIYPYGQLSQQTISIAQQQRNRQQPTDTSYQSHSINSIRQSPLLGGERAARTSANNREQSTYQRTTAGAGAGNGIMKMSSFTDAPKLGSPAGVVAAGSNGRSIVDTNQMLYLNANGSREVTPNSADGSSSTLTRTQQQQQAQSMQWSGNPLYQASMSSSSNQVDTFGNDQQCFTPTSTLTSQGSNYSNNAPHDPSCTPTPGSPTQVYSSINNGGGGSTAAYSSISNGGGGQYSMSNSATTTTAGRHSIMKNVGNRQDDSANFSLTSSNDSGGGSGVHAHHHQRNGGGGIDDYATSIV